MGFLDNVKDALGAAASKVKEGAEVAADKAKDLAETAKLKGRIAEAEKGIKDVYTQVGKDLFEKFPDLVQEKFPEHLGKVEGFKDAIEKAKAAIAALADKVEDKAEEVKEAAEEKFEDAKEAVADKAEDVKEAVEEKAADVKEAVEDKVDELKEKI